MSYVSSTGISDGTPDKFEDTVASARRELRARGQAARKQLEGFIQTLAPKPYQNAGKWGPVCKCKSRLAVIGLKTGVDNKLAVPYLCMKEVDASGMSFIFPTTLSPRYLYDYMHLSLSGVCLLCRRSLYQDGVTNFYYIEPRGWLHLLIDQLPCEGNKDTSTQMRLMHCAAEFYLLEYVLGTAQRLGDKKLESEAAAVSTQFIKHLSKVMLEYLYAACLGESRHVYQAIVQGPPVSLSVGPSPGPTKHKLHLSRLVRATLPVGRYPWVDEEIVAGSTGETTCDMCKWHHHEIYRLDRPTEGLCITRDFIYTNVSPPPEGAAAVLAYLGELFSEDGLWRSTYGGPLWSTAAQLGASIVGSSKDRTIIDRLFNICHNGGTIFSKDTHHFVRVSSTAELAGVLDIKASAQYPGHYVPLVPLVSNATKGLYRRVSELILERGECILWAGEKRGGR